MKLEWKEEGDKCKKLIRDQLSQIISFNFSSSIMIESIISNLT